MALYRQALEALHALGARRDEANVAASLARHQHDHGKLEEAIALMARVVAIRERLGDPKLVLDRQTLARWRQEREQGAE